MVPFDIPPFDSETIASVANSTESSLKERAIEFIAGTIISSSGQPVLFPSPGNAPPPPHLPPPSPLPSQPAAVAVVAMTSYVVPVAGVAVAQHCMTVGGDEARERGRTAELTEDW